MKSDQYRNNAIIEARESTIAFIEEDCHKRQSDSTNKVYALLEKRDHTHAKKIMDGYEEIRP